VRSFEALPEAPIDARGPCSRDCLARGIGNLRGLGGALRELPYGRPADRSDFAAVLAAGRGTCSTKHAFLAATAGEQAVPLLLTLGLYEMSEANTPGVGPVLAAAGLAVLPEAHCYVRWGGERIDVTRAAPPPQTPIAFLYEETIRPDQIGDYKVAWHQRHLRAWLAERGVRDWRAVWEIRERCIRALAGP
jgi:hypothetical protein